MKYITATLICLIILTASSAIVCAQSDKQPLIVGDMSGSMRGYATQSGVSVSNLYQILVRNVPAAQLNSLTTRVGPVPQNQAAYFASPKNYGGETDLASAIKSVRPFNQTAIFVTDGMQSQGMYLGIKDQLQEMAKEGWGIWLFALDLPFHDIYDTEMPVDLTTLRGDIEACAQKRDPKAKVTPKQKSNRIFDYQGLRPLLIFVFSKDTAEGRRQSLNILANLKADPRFAPQVVELAPIVNRGLGFAEPQPEDPAAYLRIDGFSTGSATIHSDTADGKRTKDIILPIVWRAEPPALPQAFNEIPNFDAQQCSWIDEEPAAEQLSGNQDPLAVAGNVRIRVISELSWVRRNFCWFPGVSCSDQKSDQLNFQATSDLTPVENAWWDELSTDNSWQCPNKVFKLSELVRGVAEQAVERQKANKKAEALSFKLIVGPL